MKILIASLALALALSAQEKPKETAPLLTDKDKITLLQLSIEGKQLQDAMKAFQAKADAKIAELKSHYPGYEPKQVSATDWALEKSK